MAKEDRIKAWTPTMRDRAQSWAQERLEAAGMSRYKARQLASRFTGGSGSIVGAADFVPFVGGGMALEEGAGLLDEGGESMKAGNVGGGLLDVGLGAMAIGGTVIPGLGKVAKFGKKAAREARIAKKVLGFSKEGADEVGGEIAKVVRKRGKRGKVAPDILRQQEMAEGQASVLRSVGRGEHLKPDGSGGYVGAPRHITSGAGLGNLRRELDSSFSEGVETLRHADPDRVGTWYDRAKAAQAATSEPYQLPRTLDQHAVYSAGVSPESELGFALKHGNSRALGGNERAYRGSGMRTLDNAVAQGKPTPLAFKVGEYRKKNDPRLPNEGLFGVNDFRAAQTFGYTTPDGKPWKAGVTATMHPFMDGETALAVDRARGRAVGGRTDWQGPHLQEVPWVTGKAEDLYGRGKKGRFKGPEGTNQALREANNTFEDYLYKHAASGTHEAIPGLSTGHVPSMLTADDAAKTAYTDAGRWDVAAPEVSSGLLDDPLQAGIGAGPRDALYSAAGFRQLPSVRATGAYRNSAGGLETNPMTIARPLMDFPTGGGGGRVDPSRAQAMTAVERFRAAIDAQEAGAWNLPNTLDSVKGKNSLVLDTRGVPGGSATTGVMPSGAQLDALTGLLDDTGYGVTATSRGALMFPFDQGATPKDLQAAMKKAGPGLREVLPGASMEKGVTSSGYVPGIGKWGEDGIAPTAPFSGEATSGLLDELAAAPPALTQNLSESEGVRSIIRQKIARDEALPGARRDIQNMRSFMAEADWNKAVEMIRKGMKPAAALAALGYSINSMAEEE
jgi:hypothetical protein